MSRYDVKMRLESQFSRMNCQMFSTGLSSGDFAGRGSRVMFVGTVSLAEGCQPGLIEEDDGVGAGSHGLGDLDQVQGHGGGGAAGQDGGSTFGLGRADGVPA
jgi:hypothetical protein